MDDFVKRSDILPWMKGVEGVIIFNALAVSRSIGQIPAADVVLVQHGRWLKNTRFKEKRRKCSECGFDSEFELNFCPNCGAQMDGRLKHDDLHSR